MTATFGRFFWYDLMTTDVPAARTFYGDVIGWKTKKWSGGDYELWSFGSEEVGGLMPLPHGSAQAGAPPMWMGYIGTENTDAMVERVVKLNGKVLSSPRDIPNVGRFAVVADPQGAVFALSSSSQPPPLPNRDGLGNFSWAELNTTDWKSAWSFYSELFGWKKTSSMDMGPQFGEYFMFGMDGRSSLGGMSNAATMMNAPPHWLHYINVKSVDALVKTISEKGGRILNGPMDVPGGDRIAQCMDPQGGVFAIYSHGASNK